MVKENKLIFIVLIMLIITVSGNTSTVKDSAVVNKDQVLDSVISKFHVEHCCHATLKTCLKKTDTCLIAKHLYWFAELAINKSYSYSKIMSQLEDRYKGFTTSKRYNIDTTIMQWAGSPRAPIRVVAYILPTCGMCKKVVGELHDSVTLGSLAGKVKLMAIPFGTGIGNVALFVANHEGRFWQMFQAMRERPGRYTEQDLTNLAIEAGIQEKTFQTLMTQENFRQMTANAKKEGVKNGVSVVPTIFINEKRYSSYKDPEILIDALEYEYKSSKHK